ncbi:aspartokinase 2, chloroplastic-like protein isoform X1 [Tanacetum coccineum]
MNHYAAKYNYASAKRNNKEDEDDRRKEEAAFNICSSLSVRKFLISVVVCDFGLGSLETSSHLTEERQQMVAGEVWKDLDGVLTYDPNIYLGAEPVPYLTYDEAVELAYFGAQVVMVDARSQQATSMAKFHLIGHIERSDNVEEELIAANSPEILREISMGQSHQRLLPHPGQGSSQSRNEYQSQNRVDTNIVEIEAFIEMQICTLSFQHRNSPTHRLARLLWIIRWQIAYQILCKRSSLFVSKQKIEENMKRIRKHVGAAIFLIFLSLEALYIRRVWNRRTT